MKRIILATLCDLDGVITDTAKIHAQAWQQMFDHFFQRYEQKSLQHHTFDIANDYPHYLDGKPRIEGIKDYFLAKNIKISMGEKDDKNKDTVYGLAYQKNQIFLKLLETQRVEIYQANVQQLKKWQAQGMPIAIVSSSKNCQHILKAANLSVFFPIVVDGTTAEQHHLKGKPQVDTYSFAAKQLNVSPESTMVIEDAAAGIAAAKNGNFALSVGLVRPSNREYIKKSLPDTLVTDLKQLDWLGKNIRFPTSSQNLVNVYEHFDKLKAILVTRKIALFLDYDGTLAPIARHPENAVLSHDMQQILGHLSQLIKVIIISGRDKAIVQQFVKLPKILYVGDHGLDLVVSRNTVSFQQKLKSFFPSLQEIRHQLFPQLLTIPGVKIEPKKYTVAIHYRNIVKQHEKRVIKITEHAVRQHPELKIIYGKKVLDISPNIEWDKGKALQCILEKFDLAQPDICPICLGDDLTDENAFRALPEQGVGILVGNHGQPTYADFRLNNPEEVKKFLHNLIKMVKDHE